MKRLFAATLAAALASTIPAIAVDPAPREPYGINLEGFPYPYPHDIPLVAVPTLFIMGADDHNAPGRPNAPEALRATMGQNAELARALATRMPNARAEVIANTGHLAFLEAPEQFDTLVLNFLK